MVYTRFFQAHVLKQNPKYFKFISSPQKQSTFFYLQQKWSKLPIYTSGTQKAHISRFSGMGTTACCRALTTRFVFPSWLQAADIPSMHRHQSHFHWDRGSGHWMAKTRLCEKHHKTSKTYQKKMNDVSSTKRKHGVHRVLYSHKVPCQKRDTRRVHLLDKSIASI